jgi:hypothetical protein
MAELTRLANGLTVAIDPMPGAQSAAIGLHAFVGSRSEADGKGGLAHLVEHMVFKGTKKRDARGIAEAIEDVGSTPGRRATRLRSMPARSRPMSDLRSNSSPTSSARRSWMKRSWSGRNW